MAEAPHSFHVGLATLPEDLWRKIMQFLSRADMARLVRVNSEIRRATNPYLYEVLDMSVGHYTPDGRNTYARRLDNLGSAYLPNTGRSLSLTRRIRLQVFDGSVLPRGDFNHLLEKLLEGVPKDELRELTLTSRPFPLSPGAMSLLSKQQDSLQILQIGRLCSNVVDPDMSRFARLRRLELETWPLEIGCGSDNGKRAAAAAAVVYLLKSLRREEEATELQDISIHGSGESLRGIGSLVMDTTLKRSNRREKLYFRGPDSPLILCSVLPRLGDEILVELLVPISAKTNQALACLTKQIPKHGISLRRFSCSNDGKESGLDLTVIERFLHSFQGLEHLSISISGFDRLTQEPDLRLMLQQHQDTLKSLVYDCQDDRTHVVEDIDTVTKCPQLQQLAIAMPGIQKETPPRVSRLPPDDQEDYGDEEEDHHGFWNAWEAVLALPQLRGLRILTKPDPQEQPYYHDITVLKDWMERDVARVFNTRGLQSNLEFVCYGRCRDLRMRPYHDLHEWIGLCYRARPCFEVVRGTNGLGERRVALKFVDADRLYKMLSRGLEAELFQTVPSEWQGSEIRRTCTD